ncbi:MAG: electron transfer flavoprotein subunit beta/FixA family protein [Planctomycetota bacterium]
MKIAVCMKRVPDTATKIRVAADNQSIDSADVQYVISPYDEFAIEEAIQIKDKVGDSTVTIYCYGPEAAQQNVRQALAMGADDGVIIQSDGAGLDPYRAAKNLAKAIQDRGGADLVLFGRASVDGQSGQVGPMVARLLDMPCLTEVVNVELDGTTIKIERESEGGREHAEAALPAALTCQKGLNEPRYANLKGIMAAKKKPIETIPAAEFSPALNIASLTPPAPRPDGKIVGEGVEAVPELVRLLREEAKVL